MNLNENNINKVDKWIFPAFEMPSLWDNEEEIYNLMQTFKRPRNIDPTSYDFKFNFWSNLLLKYATHHHVLVINEIQMKSIFTKEFKSNELTLKPLCASTILQNMVAEGKLKEVSAFDGGSLIGKLISGLGWIIKAPVSWSYNRISSVFYTESQSVSESEHPTGDLVVVDTVHHCLDEFMQWIVNHVDMHVSSHLDIITFSDFNNLLISYFPHKTSRNLAQQLLINYKQIEIISLPQPNVIKIANQTLNTTEVVKFSRSIDVPLAKLGLEKEVMDQINGLIQLRALRNKLEADERAIEEKVDHHRSCVKMSLRAGKKEEAKNQLKRSKITEKILERKRVQLQNVENMLMEIEASSDNMQVIKALSNAAGALKARSMDVDSVHDAMAEIGDTLADQEEINASINAIGDSGNNDLLDLEIELANLLSDGHQVQKNLPFLPDIPNYSLSPISKNKSATAEMH